MGNKTEKKCSSQLRLGQREFHILGTTKPNGTQVEFVPELVQGARQSLTLTANGETTTLVTSIPFVITGKFDVQEKDIAASLAQLSSKTSGERSFLLTVSSSSFSVQLCGETTCSGARCTLRAEEEKTQILLARQS